MSDSEHEIDLNEEKAEPKEKEAAEKEVKKLANGVDPAVEELQKELQDIADFSSKLHRVILFMESMLAQSGTPHSSAQRFPLIFAIAMFARHPMP